MNGEICIISYDATQHHNNVVAMLQENPTALKQFLAREQQGCDITWIACLNQQIIGVISHAGRYKRGAFVEYVKKEFRRQGIGSRLFMKAEEYYRNNHWTERVSCEFEDQEETELFLKKHGFQCFCSLYDMECRNDVILDASQQIRNYQEKDFEGYNDIQAAAFWMMRRKVGLHPNVYSELDVANRNYLQAHAKDCFVLVRNDQVVGITRIVGNEMKLLGIRPDQQRRGYGKALASYAIHEILKRGYESVRLSCVVGNDAYYMYQQLGFQVVSTTHEFTKYYRPESRTMHPYDLETPEDIILEFQQYGRIRKETERK